MPIPAWSKGLDPSCFVASPLRVHTSTWSLPVFSTHLQHARHASRPWGPVDTLVGTQWDKKGRQLPHVWQCGEVTFQHRDSGTCYCSFMLDCPPSPPKIPANPPPHFCTCYRLRRRFITCDLDLLLGSLSHQFNFFSPLILWLAACCRGSDLIKVCSL